MVRHLEAERCELLGVPAGADPGQDAVAAEEGGELREVSQDERRVLQADVGHDRADLEPLRAGRDRGGEDEGVAPLGHRRAVTAVGEEEMVVEQYAPDPGPLPARHVLRQLADGAEAVGNHVAADARRAPALPGRAHPLGPRLRAR